MLINFLEINNATFVASKKNKVLDFNLKIKNEGDIICLLGPSGIGKTTILRSIAGLVAAYFVRFYSLAFNGIKSNYLKINQSIDDSSYLLGYSKFRTFRKIHCPNLKNSIYLISILIAIEIIKELPITLILRPFNFETFATKAYAYASQDLLEAAALPSLFLIFWAGILIFLTSKHILSEK